MAKKKNSEPPKDKGGEGAFGGHDLAMGDHDMFVLDPPRTVTRIRIKRTRTTIHLDLE
jgi:hypothetical protein